jgi:PEP-CTERM motif-containing protein
MPVCPALAYGGHRNSSRIYDFRKYAVVNYVSQGENPFHLEYAFMKLPVWVCALVLVASFHVLCPVAVAAPIDISTVFNNSGFENGNISSWTVTRPNGHYVANLSPSVNPSINPADLANDPAMLVAPAGSCFTGLTSPGKMGPDLNYKLAHNAIALSVPTGTTFQISLFANRGRLEPFDTPFSTADVFVKVFGWTTGTTIPTVTAGTDNWSRSIGWNPASVAFDFTGVADGVWGNRTITFDPAAMGINAANLKYLAVFIVGQTHNHDQYVAMDVGIVPEPGTILLLSSGLAFLSVRMRAGRRTRP